jgi:ribonuclease P protein component
MRTHVFKKSERLSSKTIIKELFEKGSSFYLYPFKVLFLANSEVGAISHKVLITVPKRNFRRANKRNLLRRRIKEAYRLQKPALSGPPYLLIAYIYTSKEVLSFKELEETMKSAHHRLLL